MKAQRKQNFKKTHLRKYNQFSKFNLFESEFYDIEYYF